MKLTDLIVSPKSLGDKLWLVDVSPAYEYKDGKRTDTVLGYRYSVATLLPCPKRAWIKSMYALTDSSRQRPRMAMWKCALMGWKCLFTGPRVTTMWGQRQPESIS